MQWWMATRYLGGFSAFPTAARHISANAFQRICGVSRAWQRWSINWGSHAHTWKSSMLLALCTFFSKGGAILSYARRSSSIEVVAHKAFCRQLGYILYVSGNGQQWVNRYAAQIPRFAKSLCVGNYTQSGWNRPQCHSSKPCGYNSEVLSIEWAAAGIYAGCPTGAKHRFTHMATEHWTHKLW